MKTAYARTLLGALACLVATAASAQHAQLVSHMQFAELQQDFDAELGQLKARLASLEEGDMAVLQKDAGCCCCDCWCNPCCGWTGSAEIVFLRPHDSLPDTISGTDLQTGTRITLAHMNDCGRSWRVRYLHYHNDAWDLGNGAGETLTINVWDIEYAARFELGCNWRGEIAAGLRHAEFDDNSDPANATSYDSTIGPVISAEVRNELWCDVDIFALYRRSQQFGTDENSDDLGTFGITEIQVGAEVTRCVAGNDLFIRGFIEAQEWAGIEDGASDDLGLIGLGFAVGLAR